MRREDSTSSGVFLTPPGVGFLLRDDTYGSTNPDVFVPEAPNTVERRALQKIDLFAALVAEPQNGWFSSKFSFSFRQHFQALCFFRERKVF